VCVCVNIGSGSSLSYRPLHGDSAACLLPGMYRFVPARRRHHIIHDYIQSTAGALTSQAIGTTFLSIKPTLHLLPLVVDLLYTL